MTPLKDTPANVKQIGRLRQTTDEGLDETLRKGFHGTLTVEASIQDGTIQHVCRRVEKIEKWPI